MSFIDTIRHRLRVLFSEESVRRERDEEIAFHLALSAKDAEQDGLSSAAAQREALRRFGNATDAKETARGVSRVAWLDAVGQDLRYAVRSIRRSPGYTFGAAATLAIGIGATTAVYSIFDTLVLHALPYGNVAQLHAVFERRDDGAQRLASYPTFRDWMADSATWRGTIEGMVFMRGRSIWLDRQDVAERVLVANVSAGFFPLMRTATLLGRTFLPGEERTDGERVAVLSFDGWRRYYGGDEHIVGRIVSIDSAPVRIVGVMPRGFTYPNWVPGGRGNTNLWMPLAHVEATDAALWKRGDHADSRVIARLVPSADSATAASALNVLAARLGAAYPNDSKRWTRMDLSSVRNGALGNVTQLVKTLGAAVGLVLLLACINVANLTFVRGTVRARELAVRAALGANRGRIVRQLLTEIGVIAVLSAVGGLVLASLILAGTRSLGATQLAGAEYLGLNTAMFAFAFGVAAITAMIAAIVPALRSTRSERATVRGGTHGATGGRVDARIRSTLVVVQLGLALVLLVGTGLLVRSFRNVSAVPLGYDPNGLVRTRITPPARYATASDALTLYRSILDRVRAIPGVTDVAFSNEGPLSSAVTVEGAGVQREGTASITPQFVTVSEGFLATMKMELVAGRWLTASDMQTRDQFVINEPLARQLFPGKNPIGQRIVATHAARVRPELGQPAPGTIVGVVRDGGTPAGGTPLLNLYVPYTLDVWQWGALYVRTTNVAAAIPLVRDAIRDADPAIQESRASGDYGGAAPVSALVSSGLAQRRLVLSAIGAFALAALLLATVGLYSVMSYVVSQRTREVGVRIALGATQRGILGLVLGEGTRLAVYGAALGCSAAVLATRLIRTMLVGTTTTDISTYVVTALALLGTAMIASYIPARRAARLSPVDAIRAP